MAVWAGIAIAWRFSSTLILPPGASNPMLQFIYASQLPCELDEFVCGIAIAKLVQAGALQFAWWHFITWGAAALILLTLAWVTVPADRGAILAKHCCHRALAAGFAALLASTVMLPTGSGGVQGSSPPHALCSTWGKSAVVFACGICQCC